MNGDFYPLREAFSRYIGRFYQKIYPDTPALTAFVKRGLSSSVVWAPDRLVDSVEEMLKSYQKNRNNADLEDYAPGRNARFPIIVLGMAKDSIPTGGDFGGRMTPRRLVHLTDDEDASVYGYRQSMLDIRVQVVLMCAESASARSLASQLSLFASEPANRRFPVTHRFGQYELEMTCMLESSDLYWMNALDSPAMTVFYTDITLKAVIPYVDAPRPDEENDGSSHNPPGYPVVTEFKNHNQVNDVVRYVPERDE